MKLLFVIHQRSYKDYSTFKIFIYVADALRYKIMAHISACFYKITVFVEEMAMS